MFQECPGRCGECHDQVLAHSASIATLQQLIAYLSLRQRAFSPFTPRVTDQTSWNSLGWLNARGDHQALLHNRAGQVAAERFGRRVFLRGVVEVSNYCRENCVYCGMRRENSTLSRFRAQHEQLAELLVQQRPPSVTDINIQTGEDPVAVREVVLPLIRTLKRETRLGISVCLGTLSASLYDQLRQAGATVYIMK